MYLSNRYYQLQFSHTSVYFTMFYVSRCVIFNRYFMSVLLDISIVNQMRFQNTYIVCKYLCTTGSLCKTVVLAWNAARLTGRALDQVMAWCWPRASRTLNQYLLVRQQAITWTISVTRSLWVKKVIIWYVHVSTYCGFKICRYIVYFIYRQIRYRKFCIT